MVLLQTGHVVEGVQPLEKDALCVSGARLFSRSLFVSSITLPASYRDSSVAEDV
jgi:hypothetical protein